MPLELPEVLRRKLGGARMPMAPAWDGLFFGIFGTVDPLPQRPAFAIALQAVWTAGLISVGAYEAPASYTLIAACMFYTLTLASVIVLRRTFPHASRPYRAWGYAFTLIVLLIISVWFVANPFVTQPVPSLWALAITGSGVPVYFIWRKRARISNLCS